MVKVFLEFSFVGRGSWRDVQRYDLCVTQISLVGNSWVSNPFVVFNACIYVSHMSLQEHTPLANPIAKTSRTGSTQTHAQLEWTHFCHSGTTSH